jgi:hypothetical protein
LLVLSIAPDELRAATYIVRRTVLQIWQIFDSITISTDTHPIRTLTWAVSTSWADAANGPLAWVNICGIVSFIISMRNMINLYQSHFKRSLRKIESIELFSSPINVRIFSL